MMVTINVEFMFNVIHVLFVIISFNAGAAFETLVSGFALRAVLGAFSALVLIARPANWEPALIARHKQISIHRQPHIVPAYLTHLPIQVPQWFVLQASNIRKHQKNIKHIHL